MTTELDEQILVIGKTGAVPLYCACCRFPMKTIEDTISFRRVGVCRHCDNKWTNYPGIDWKNREMWPKKDSEEWMEYIELRALYAKPILNLK
jgi:hypothetical protein